MAAPKDNNGNEFEVMAMHYHNVITDVLAKYQFSDAEEMIGPLLELLRMAHDAAVTNAAEGRRSYHDGLESVTGACAESMAEGVRNLARVKASIFHDHAKTAGAAGQVKERDTLQSQAVRLQAFAEILDRCLAIWNAKHREILQDN